jgi:hypothetical protein
MFCFFKLLFEVCLKKIHVYLLAVLFFLGTSPILAQNVYSKPYLVSASIYMAADAQADVWLNGIHVAHCPHTTMAASYKTFEAKPRSLCYFKNTNVLAIKLMGSKRSADDHFIGVAYAIRFRLSDGSFWMVNSSTARANRCFYLPHREDEPDGWEKVGFDDSGWQTAQSSGDMIPNTASLAGGYLGGAVGFLTASNNGYFVQYVGEKQLFRRYFSLDIGVNPRCLQSELAPPSQVWPNVLPVVNYSATSAVAQKISITPEVLPAHQQPLQAAPQLQHPLYGSNFALILRPAQIGSASSLENPYPVASIMPSPSTSPNPSNAGSNIQVNTPSVQTTRVEDDGAIVFGPSSANILVTFGDGPGLYKVEAVDENSMHLKTLLNQRIITDAETWLTWDGKDDQGNGVPAGRYYILCSKAGTVLQKILLRRVP